MAEGFFNHATKKHHAVSAGTQAVERIELPMPDFVIKCMKAIGIDVSKHYRKQLNEKMVKEADKVIIITSKEDCPAYLRNSDKAVFWDIPDAKDQDYEFHCKVRDGIRERVKVLIKNLK